MGDRVTESSAPHGGDEAGGTDRRMEEENVR